jgi:hypothetical protein
MTAAAKSKPSYSPEVQAFWAKHPIGTVTPEVAAEFVQIAWKSDAEYRRQAIGFDPGADFPLPEDLAKNLATKAYNYTQAAHRIGLEKAEKFIEKDKYQPFVDKEIEYQLAHASEDFKNAIRTGNRELAERLSAEMTQKALDAARDKACKKIKKNTMTTLGRECSECQNNPVDDKVSFLVCSRCKEARYCSKDCQRAAWPAHKPVCVIKPKTAGEGSDAGDGKSNKS